MVFLFDFDGTLVDSMGVFGEAMLSLLDANGIPYGDDMVKTVTPLGYQGTAEYFVSLGVKATVEELMEKMIEHAKDAYAYRIEAKEDVTETLHALHAAGHSLNILTASPHVAIDPCLKRLGLYPLFDNVWSSDDFGMKKSDPAIYCMAAERLGVPVSAVTFLDDNIHACLTAKTAGMRVFGVYDASSADMAEEMRAKTHRYLKTLAELLK